jgi:hypothetical protein
MIRIVNAATLMLGGVLCLTGTCLIGTHASAAPPIPLNFALGSYGVMANGHVTPGEPLQTYTFNANAGQQMIVTFVGAGPMRGQVQCLGGGDGPYYGAGNTFTIPATGLCQVIVGANTMAETWTGGFTLAVLVR